MNYYLVAAIAFAVLVLTLIGAKLAGIIHWAWWLVLTPLWTPIVLACLVVIVAIAIFAQASSGGKNPFQ